jgi:sugar O-acyltransferase (sialic acid O-acetyltransferase NeuD family)
MSDDMEEIFVFGASGHAKVVIDIIEREGRFRIVAVADDDPVLDGKALFGYPIIGGKSALLAAGIRRGIVAIGSNRARAAVATWLEDHGFDLVTAIHPAALIGREVSIGCGTIVMAGAIINPATHIGRNVIVNTRASIDHDCIVGDNVHIAPGTTLCGTVTVGSGCLICAGATIIPNLTIGADSIVGAGSTVIRNLPDRITAVGSPARIISQE